MPKPSAAVRAVAAAPAPVPPAPPQTPAAASPALTGSQRALQRLNLVRPIDLALHLPLRYEDETQVLPIAALRPTDKAQVEGTVIEAHVEARARRQLVVTLGDDSGATLLQARESPPCRSRALPTAPRR